MATWKKLLVSGSNISQLTNDAGYLTSETTQTAYVTASVGGQHLIANSSEGKLNFATGSTSISIVGTPGNDTLTFDISNGIVSGSSQVDFFSLDNLPSGLVTGSAQIDGASITNKAVSFGGVSVNLGSSDSTPAFNLSDATAYVGDSALVTLGTVSTGNIERILPTGTVSGSISVPSQGSISINGITHDLQLQTGDSPTFSNGTITNNLYVGGNMTVSGTTTALNVANLDIEDKFILLNSGSSSATDESGIIFGGSGGAAMSGSSLFWNGNFNGNDGRLAIGHGVSNTSGNGTVPNYFVPGVISGSEANAATALADHYGNIRIEAGEIFMYV